MPRSITASTSTTDSPPPQSPLTPPPYELQLSSYVTTKDVQMFDVDSRIGEFNSLSPTHLSSQFPTSTLPAPPSGHDLMQLFPPRPPQVVLGLDRNVRREVNNTSPRNLGPGVPAYINTSAYFGKEEREFFRLAGERVTGRDLEIRLEKERENRDMNMNINIKEGSGRETSIYPQIPVEPPIKRRKSVDIARETTSSPPPPALTLGKLPQRQQQQQQHTPSHSHWPATISSFQVLQQPTPTAGQIQPVTSSGTRRRAGKYTKRVFVHPNPLPNVNPPYLLANVYPPVGPNSTNPTINVYPLANPLPQKIPVPYQPNSPSHSSFPQPTSQFVQFAR
ncbi:hypothetical protein Clacol_008287 [Clathrus columnatus]|uniref:Uncharacterized protein n=1 Tax=Clathrus columnatus TaxID=1419009 RepID=A0AAV5AME4_9AGAM|nr:hypothetical protein Clacol_008287 [Clathrus columnatus]